LQKITDLSAEILLFESSPQELHSIFSVTNRNYDLRYDFLKTGTI